MSAKNSVDSVRYDMIAKMSFLLPSRKEQEKIVALLSLIDERIVAQNKIIEELKKLRGALAEQLFCSKENNNPKLRFNVFHNAWNEIPLNKICERIKTKNVNLHNNNVLTISATQGIVNQENYFNQSVASKNLSNYYLIRNGDFAYNKSYSKEYAWGAIKRLDLYSEGVLSPLYICFRFNKNLVDLDYLTHYFETSKWHKSISDIAGEGARNHGLLNISIVDFFKTYHKIPSKEEQIYISNFLNPIKEKIQNEILICNQLYIQKNCLLKNLFI